MTNMARLYVVLGFVGIAVYIYALVDTISTREWQIKSLNKIAWVFIVILLPVIGAILWFIAGRARGNGASSVRRGSRRPIAPDDDPEFLRNVSKSEQQEARIRQLEAELKALDDDAAEE
jgi:hypothetical protein